MILCAASEVVERVYIGLLGVEHLYDPAVAVCLPEVQPLWRLELAVVRAPNEQHVRLA